MTKDFDIVSEQKISISNQVESTFVNVGWGSFETQFKGSAGKHATKAKTEERLLAWDDRRARVSWRSDGEYFVVHFVVVDDNITTNGITSERRKFQVFTRDGLLHANVEEHTNALDAHVAWTCARHQHIAAAIQRLNKHEIVFFERNGLSHGSFALPFAYERMRVNGLAWNLDSTILCVWCEPNQSDDDSDFHSIG